MHLNFDHVENFENQLAAEFNTEPRVPYAPGRDRFDSGQKIVDALSCDLELDAGVLDLDDLS